MKRSVLITAILICVILAVIITTSAFSFNYTLPFFGRIVVQQSSIMCNETDDGVLFYTKGTISLCNGTACIVKGEDVCKDTSTITEYYCSAKNEVKSLELECPYGCDDGACLTLGQKPRQKEEQVQEIEKSAEEQVKEIICNEGWTCVGKSKIYQNLDCSFIKEKYCKYGCIEGECKEAGFWDKFLLWLRGQLI